MKLSRATLLPLLMLTLSSCASLNSLLPKASTEQPAVSTPTRQGTGETKLGFVSCTSLFDIELSHTDSDGTKKQVLKYNKIYDSGCPRR